MYGVVVQSKIFGPLSSEDAYKLLWNVSDVALMDGKLAN